MPRVCAQLTDLKASMAHGASSQALAHVDAAAGPASGSASDRTSAQHYSGPSPFSVGVGRPLLSDTIFVPGPGNPSASSLPQLPVMVASHLAPTTARPRVVRGNSSQELMQRATHQQGHLQQQQQQQQGQGQGHLQQQQQQGQYLGSGQHREDPAALGSSGGGGGGGSGFALENSSRSSSQAIASAQQQLQMLSAMVVGRRASAAVFGEQVGLLCASMELHDRGLL